MMSVGLRQGQWKRANDGTTQLSNAHHENATISQLNVQNQRSSKQHLYDRC